MFKMAMKRVLLILGCLAFLAMIVDAALRDSVVTGLREVLATPWGRVTLADLGIGLVFAGCWIATLIGWRRALPWLIALALLGNLTLLLFLALRARHCRDLQTLLLQPTPRR